MDEELVSSTQALNFMPVNNFPGRKSIGRKGFSWAHAIGKDYSLSLHNFQGGSQHKQCNFVKQKLSCLEENGEHQENSLASLTDNQVGSEYSFQVQTRLLERLSSLNGQLEGIVLQLGKVEKKLSIISVGCTPSQQNLSAHVGPSIATTPCAYGRGNSIGSAISHGVSNYSVTTEYSIIKEGKIPGKGKKPFTPEEDQFSGFDCSNHKEIQQQKRDDISMQDTVCNVRTSYFQTTVGFLLLSLGFIIGAVGAKSMSKR